MSLYFPFSAHKTPHLFLSPRILSANLYAFLNARRHETVEPTTGNGINASS